MSCFYTSVLSTTDCYFLCINTITAEKIVSIDERGIKSNNLWLMGRQED